MSNKIARSSFLIIFSLLVFGCKENETSPQKSVNNTLTFTFEHFVNGEALKLNNPEKYKNALGQEFTVEEFKYYISNIKLRNLQTGAFYLEPDSYHLAFVSNNSNTFSFDLDSLPIGDFNEIEFSIGVDNGKNSSLDKVGDLDPNSNMAWEWETGYKFLLFEGKYFTPETGVNGAGLIFHVGENKNFKTLRFRLNDLGLPLIKTTKDSKQNVKIDVEVTELWKDPNPIDFDVTNKAMAGEDAERTADNYKEGMFLIKEVK
jgi:hypothetical protein